MEEQKIMTLTWAGREGREGAASCLFITLSPPRWSRVQPGWQEKGARWSGGRCFGRIVLCLRDPLRNSLRTVPPHTACACVLVADF